MSDKAGWWIGLQGYLYFQLGLPSKTRAEANGKSEESRKLGSKIKLFSLI